MTDDQQTPPAPKQQEQDQHRRTILDAAVRLFAERGYHQTTMQMIAERAEFSVGYLYRHFPGKEDIYRELLQFHLDQMDAIIRESNAMDLPPLEQFRRSLTRIADHYNRHPDFMRIYHEEIAQHNELERRKGPHMLLLIQMLTSAQDRGELAPGDPSLLAAAIQGAIKELFFELAERGGERPFDPLPGVVWDLLIEPRRP